MNLAKIYNHFSMRYSPAVYKDYVGFHLTNVVFWDMFVTISGIAIPYDILRAMSIPKWRLAHYNVIVSYVW